VTNPEFLQVHRAIGELRRCVDVLSARASDSPALRRLTNDVDRLDLDAEDVRLQLALPVPLPDASADSGTRSGTRGATIPIVQIRDDPYAHTLWHGADDEGIGGHRRQHR
jgi:hypothetical protein